ncbi:terminase small subunit, partial [Staphylococcus aureus]
MSELTAKQARFVNEYIRTLNVTQSAIKAGYSANSAHVTGCRLLKKPH